MTLDKLTSASLNFIIFNVLIISELFTKKGDQDYENSIEILKSTKILSHSEKFYNKQMNMKIYMIILFFILFPHTFKNVIISSIL